MNVSRRTVHRSFGAAGLVAAWPALAVSSYPTRPITLIVPFAAGGGNDTVARVIGQTIGKSLGQQVIVDNKPGAGGSLGAELAARALPDGYTLFLGGVGSHALNPTIRKLGYDPVKGFRADRVDRLRADGARGASPRCRPTRCGS